MTREHRPGRELKNARWTALIVKEEGGNMGWRLSWFAVQAQSLDAICDDLGLELLQDNQDSSSSEPLPEKYVFGANLPSEWCLIVAEIDRDFWVSNSLLEQISAKDLTIACDVCEETLRSAVSGWINGKMIWSVTHDSQIQLTHLEEKGSLPREYEDVRKKLFMKQTEQDIRNAGKEVAHADYIFDIPSNLAKELTGFRYNQGINGRYGSYAEQNILIYPQIHLTVASLAPMQASWIEYPSDQRNRASSRAVQKSWFSKLFRR